jgi:hypothetical protein
MLQLVDPLKSLHLRIVGGDPLIWYRQLEAMVSQPLDSGVHSQIVTSGFRPLTAGWMVLPNFTPMVSTDGLQPNTTSGCTHLPPGASQEQRAKRSAAAS